MVCITECHCEASIMRGSWPTRGCCVIKKKSKCVSHIIPIILVYSSICLPWRSSHSWSRPPHYRGFTITLSHTHHTRKESSGRVIRLTQAPLPDNTQHTTLTKADIHAPDGIQNHIPSKQAAADTRLRLRGHWDWPVLL